MTEMFVNSKTISSVFRGANSLKVKKKSDSEIPVKTHTGCSSSLPAD